MNRNFIAVAVAIVALISSLSLGWMMTQAQKVETERIEKLELALIILSRGEAESILAMPLEELRGIITEAKKNVAPPVQQPVEAITPNQ